jgi:ribosomal protein S18 acetylase RimI-like enzyme
MDSPLSIIMATPTDAETVAKILAHGFAEYQANYTSQAFEATVINPEEVKDRMRRGVVWIVKANNEAAGTASGKRIGESFYVYGMAVIPSARNRKIGYQLLKTIEKYAMEHDCHALLLSTTPYLTRAIQLYQRFGFEIVNEPPYEFFGTPLFNLRKSLVSA